MAFTARIGDLIEADETGLLAKHASWARVNLGEVVSILSGAPFDASLFSNAKGHPLVRIRDVREGSTTTGYAGNFDEAFRVDTGDLLVGMDGDFHCAIWRSGAALLNQRVCKLTADERFVDRRFLAFALPGYLSTINANTPSITVKHLSSRTIAEIELALPPRDEQSRIVAKLDELFSDLDAGVVELRAAQKKLAIYRKSLLKAAVDGALTAEWRARNPARETGAQLLERLLIERRARWEGRQLARFKAQGSPPPKGWQGKYGEPTEPDTTGFPELPQGWVWASLGQLLAGLTSGSRDWAPYYDRGHCVFVMAQNVRPWRPDLTFRQLVDPPENDRDRDRSAICKDDLLVTIVGANTGQSCRVPDALDSHFVCQSVALLRPIEPATSEFLNAVLNSDAHGQLHFRAVNYGAGRPHLSFEQIEAVAVPLPPLAEQAELLTVLGEALRTLERLEALLARLLTQSTAQRQNLLRAAFSGQLVPQDPDDEPAAVLLARLRADRAARAAVKKSRGRGPKVPR